MRGVDAMVTKFNTLSRSERFHFPNSCSKQPRPNSHTYFEGRGRKGSLAAEMALTEGGLGDAGLGLHTF